MNAPAALRAAADTVEACAIGERVDAIICLMARAAERAALGTLVEDDVADLLRAVRG